MKTIGVIGSGTMGSGIAQIAASYGYNAVLYDNNSGALKSAFNAIRFSVGKLIEKNKIPVNSAEEVLNRINFTEKFNDLAACDLVIEAIIEDLNIKQKVFTELEAIVSENCILATNTSSLSVTSIASALKHPERFIGLHFFNPAPLMKLVEVVPGLRTIDYVVTESANLMQIWEKTTVIAKDTPGFIVNKVARPFYGEALRIYEEGIADFATIDWAMKTAGGFRMGPFELMDLIGNDVNYKVTETVFHQMYYDGRYRPSITQLRYVESGLLGRKTERGFYDYSDGAEKLRAIENNEVADLIFLRIFSMILNEAADTVFRNIASPGDCDTALKLGVNYPFGAFEWAEKGNLNAAVETLNSLYARFKEERYRISPLLMDWLTSGNTSYAKP